MALHLGSSSLVVCVILLMWFCNEIYSGYLSFDFLIMFRCKLFL